MRFYDHVKNQLNPAIASAMARCRKDGGTLLRIEFSWDLDEAECFWEGDPLSVRQLERDLNFNNCRTVKVMDVET